MFRIVVKVSSLASWSLVFCQQSSSPQSLDDCRRQERMLLDPTWPISPCMKPAKVKSWHGEPPMIIHLSPGKRAAVSRRRDIFCNRPPGQERVLWEAVHGNGMSRLTEVALTLCVTPVMDGGTCSLTFVEGMTSRWVVDARTTGTTSTFWLNLLVILCEWPQVFFCLMAAWLNEGRCPGGRPSVSTN